MVEAKKKKKKNMLGAKLSLLSDATFLFHIWFIFCTIDRLSYLLYYHNWFSTLKLHDLYLSFQIQFQISFRECLIGSAVLSFFIILVSSHLGQV